MEAWKDELYHHGVPGMHWGVRNGPPYPLDRANSKYVGKTIFISGSSKTQTLDSDYYRKKLPRDITKQIDRYLDARSKIIVGDAPGVDRQVQLYLKRKKYGNVEVYGPGEQVRYSADKKWKTNPINAPQYERGSKEWLAAKDIEMSKRADFGLAVILDEGAKATRKNVDRMMSDNKEVVVYQLNRNGKDTFIKYK